MTSPQTRFDDIDDFAANAGDGAVLDLAPGYAPARTLPQYNVSVLGAREIKVFHFHDMVRHQAPARETVTCVETAEIYGQSIVEKDGKLYLGHATVPGYLREISGSPDYQRSFGKQKETITRSVHHDAIFVAAHFHSRIYGHFLTECLPSVFSIKAFYDRGIRHPIYIGGMQPKFLRAFVQLVIPEAEFFVCPPDARVTASKLFLPGFYPMDRTPPRLCDAISDLAARVSQTVDQPDVARRIFVSRSGVKDQSARVLSDAEATERTFAEAGFRIVHPETLDLPEQIALFHNARVVAGEYGSGLHNTIFSRPGTTVISLNWLNIVQQAIGVKFGQRNIFVFPRTGEPVLIPTSRQDHATAFDIDPEMLKNTLDFVARLHADL